ncbi:MAG TPA: four-helix bundle copper-binding protein [Polyangiaceae bacterium]|nr:four-helix bundle copper-binding protein [Polyangiaceae bacterium]
MNSLQQILSASPSGTINRASSLAQCIEACLECEVACVACADACLGEREVDHLRRCIRFNLDCADICGATGRVLSRQLEADVTLLHTQIEACARVCLLCEAECERHASMHKHCRSCAEVCRRCAERCQEALQAKLHVGAERTS